MKPIGILFGVVLVLSAACFADNLVTNGGFETCTGGFGANPQGWTLSGPNAIGSGVLGWAAQSGNCGMVLNVLDYAPWSPSTTVLQSDPMTTVALAKYSFSFWINSWYPGATGFVVSWDNTPVVTISGPTSGWTLYSFQVTASGNDTVSFALPNTSWYELDNVSVVVPEPGSLLLLGTSFASIAALRRRRK